MRCESSYDPIGPVCSSAAPVASLRARFSQKSRSSAVPVLFSLYLRTSWLQRVERMSAFDPLIPSTA